jgi:hypothetical protein
MGHTAPTTITRIVNEVPVGEQPFTENDFSARTIERHKQAGYLIAKRALGDEQRGLGDERRAEVRPHQIEHAHRPPP